MGRKPICKALKGESISLLPEDNEYFKSINPSEHLFKSQEAKRKRVSPSHSRFHHLLSHVDARGVAEFLVNLLTPVVAVIMHLAAALAALEAGEASAAV